MGLEPSLPAVKKNRWISEVGRMARSEAVGRILRTSFRKVHCYNGASL
jgi:hypothetical protein